MGEIGKIGRDPETVKGCHAAHVEDVPSSLVVVVVELFHLRWRSYQTSAQLGEVSNRGMEEWMTSMKSVHIGVGDYL